MNRFFALLFVLPFAFISCKKDVENSNALSAIPVNSAFVVRINNLADFNRDMQASVPAKALQQSVVFTQLNNFTQLLGNLNTSELNNVKAFGSYHVSGAGTYGWIWSTEEDKLPFLSKTALASKGTIESRDYSGSTIHHFTSDAVDFYFAKVNGLVLLSANENLVENGLKQLASNISLSDYDVFMKALATVNAKDPINVFVNYPALPDWLSTLVKNKPNWAGNLATWSALDLDINENDLTLTGLTMVPDSASVYAGLFENAGAGNATFEEIIPESAAMVVNQSCGDFSQWSNNFEEYLGKHNRLKKRNQKLEQLGIQPNLWIDMVDEEMGVFYADGSAAVNELKCAYIRVSKAEEALTTLQKSSTLIEQNYRNYTIYKLNKRNTLPLVYGQIFSHLPEPNWIIHNNWLVFANDVALLKTHINALMAQKTWANSENYNRLSALIDNDANLIVLAKNPEWLKLAQKELTEQNAADLAKNTKTLSEINWFLVQLKQRKHAAYTEVVMHHQTEQIGSAKQFWSVQLDAPAINKPQFVLNHYSKENEVVIQDEAHNLYLIDKSGKVLWKKALNGPVLGDVNQVDLYKNRKLQLAFVTPQSFYIVDRNGNDVKPFPISLPAQASAPLAVLDYANNRNYRFLIPAGKKLLNYNAEGKQVKGWNFTPAKATLITQAKHSVIGNKDYIYLADKIGNVYVLNRRGEIRVPLTNKMRQLASELYLTGKNTSSAKIIGLSKSGHQLSIYLNNNLDSIQPFGEDPAFFLQKGDKQVFAGEEKLYYRSKKANFDIDLEDEITATPGFYNVSGKLFIAATCGENVYVYDELGNLLSGMPVYGSGSALVGKFTGNTVHVLVTSEDGTLQDYKLIKP